MCKECRDPQGAFNKKKLFCRLRRRRGRRGPKGLEDRTDSIRPLLPES